MKRISYHLFLLSAMFLLISCENSTDVLGDDALRVTTSASSITLSNTSSQQIYYVLMESETAARTDLAPISEWPTIAPHSHITIPYDQIDGYTDEATELTLLWRAKKSPSGASLRIAL